ncbi:MAG: TSUP family transporter [Lachnospiraceae bacterium]
MINVIFFGVCFAASVIGAICGIGGGVIIKPALDAVHILDTVSISFLSGCTVLSMSAYSVIKSRINKITRVDKRGIHLTVGAVIGGITGKLLFQNLVSISNKAEKVSGIQAICLLLITIGTLCYTIKKESIKSRNIAHRFGCIGIGMMLGAISAFLGIGGGPLNLVVLYYFFSMDTKTAAENSLYIIFFSQLASLVQTGVARSIPDFQSGILVLMVAGGIGGGVLGRAVNRRMDEKGINKLFIWIMLVMIGLNMFNIYKFI